MDQQARRTGLREVSIAVEMLAQVARESFDAAQMNTGADPEAMLGVLALGLRAVAADIQAIEEGGDAAEVAQ